MRRERFHFIGIGGAGMAPLAEILLQRGAEITGSDRLANEKTAHLCAHGATVFTGHDASHLPSAFDGGQPPVVVYSSAVGEDNPELALARSRNWKCLRRGEMLAELLKLYRRVVAVSASHGKTGTTALLSFLAERADLHPGYMIGGAVNGGFPSSAAGNGDLFITEADESDGTHTLLFPYLGIVPNAEDDHAWSVGGEAQLFANYQKFAFQSRHLLVFDTPDLARLFSGHPDLHAVKLPPTEDFLEINRTMVFAAAEFLGISKEIAISAAKDFPGVARRLTPHFFTPELAVVEDYAHHPTELRRSIASLRSHYPGRHLRIVFQPHRYARLSRYLEAFAEELRKADSVLIAPVFAAWCEAGPVNSGTLAEKIGSSARACTGSWAEIAKSALENPSAEPLLLAVIGAGDIEEIFPFLPPFRYYPAMK